MPVAPPTTLWAWVSARTGLGAGIERLRARRVSALSAPHLLGGVLLMLFLVEVASGILLMLPYRPDPQHAHASIVAIAGRLPYGGLVRGVHAWASQLLVATLIAHMLWALLTRAYREPKELVWWTGLGLLLVGLALAFTGAILPWSQEAYLQARVSSDMVGHGPLFGPWLRRMLRGGADLGPWSLNHAYGFHTGVLPALTTTLFALHIAFMSPARAGALEPPAGPTVPVYPDFLIRVAAACTAMLVAIVTLATFVPVAVGAPANPAASVSSGEVRPPWYFLFLHDLLRRAPPRLLGLESPQFILGALSLLVVFAVALPLIDRRGSKITAYVGAFLVVVFLALTGHALL